MRYLWCTLICWDIFCIFFLLLFYGGVMDPRGYGVLEQDLERCIPLFSILALLTGVILLFFLHQPFGICLLVIISAGPACSGQLSHSRALHIHVRCTPYSVRMHDLFTTLGSSSYCKIENKITECGVDGAGVVFLKLRRAVEKAHRCILARRCKARKVDMMVQMDKMKRKLTNRPRSSYADTLPRVLSCR